MSTPDCHPNPPPHHCFLTLHSHLQQAISRVWRYGQKQPSYIYHLIYEGTFETRVFERVLAKEELFLRVSVWVGWWLVELAV